jgi:hypothetical protein
MRIIVFFILVALVGCTTRVDTNDTPNSILGYAPVYASVSSYQNVELQGSKPTVQAGKIYAYGNYIFQAEQNEGVHIIAEGQSKNAHKVGFLKVPFCSEIAVKGNYLYVNNLNDLLVFDISNVAAPQLIRRLPDAFPHINQQYPNVSGTFFECVDPSKGIVVRWEEKTLSNPKCRR